MKPALSVNQSHISHQILPIVAFAAVAMATVLLGCAADSQTPYVRDGREFGKVKGAFRGRWWNYYERGLSFAEGRFYARALSDLRAAASQRDRDQRMARTYGMHFIDYFPHRELGILHFDMGDLHAAKVELETSQSHFPSAKARFYLDRVRRESIERERIDVAPPELTLELVRGEIWTSDDPVMISGYVRDAHFVSAITVNGKAVLLEQSLREHHFREPLSLVQGEHTIAVSAANLMGMETERSVVFHVDREGPVISIAELRSDLEEKGYRVGISGSAYDEAGITGVTINARPIPIEKGKEVFFTEEVLTEGDRLQLVASDALGNRTVALISVAHTREHKPVLLSYLDSDRPGPVALLGSRDTHPPVINVKDLTDTLTVYLDRYYLEVMVRDDSKIDTLSVNGLPVHNREGNIIFFPFLLDLQEGRNDIFIRATDVAGNTGVRRVVVTREVPEPFRLSARLSMTVMPFKHRGEVSGSSSSFQSSLLDALVNLNRFKMVERERMDSVLQELKLSRTRLIDRRTALHLGRQMAARSIVAGDILQTRKGIEIVARIIDTETAEILTTEDVYDEVTDPLALRVLAQGMAAKIHREFPLLRGMVVERYGEHIISDLGIEKVKASRRLIIYRDRRPTEHPLTGLMLNLPPKILGQAQITQVMSDSSEAVLLGGKGAASIGRLDRVITE